jgi:hypothetical protein
LAAFVSGAGAAFFSAAALALATSNHESAKNTKRE